MSAPSRGSDATASDQYGQSYYASHCGPVPYDRSQPVWSEFFGAIADELIRLYQPRRVFDAGCALGFLVEALRDRGVEAFGRDLSVFSISQVRDDVKPYCTVGSLVDPINGHYDLVVCIEVLEHLPEHEARHALANLTAATDKVVFSSSPSDFDEPTHLNVQPAIYWMRLFAELGFVPAIMTTFPSITSYALCYERTGRDGDEGERARAACAEVVRLRMEAEVTGFRCRSLEGELAGRDTLIGDLRREIADGNEIVGAQSDAISNNVEEIERLNLRIERNEYAARVHAALVLQRDARIAELERNVAALAHVADSAERRAHSEAQYARLAQAYDAVLSSTSWRLLHPVRVAGVRLPPTLRRRLRRGLKAAWWLSTLQLGRLGDGFRNTVGSKLVHGAAPVAAPLPHYQVHLQAGAMQPRVSSSNRPVPDEELYG